jgi:hypothetical protein
MTFETIYNKAHVRESMTGALMELCKIIKWPNPQKIIDKIGKIHTIEAAEDAAKDLTINNPDKYDEVLDIIIEETVKADESERRYALLAEK